MNVPKDTRKIFAVRVSKGSTLICESLWLNEDDAQRDYQKAKQEVPSFKDGNFFFVSLTYSLPGDMRKF